MKSFPSGQHKCLLAMGVVAALLLVCAASASADQLPVPSPADQAASMKLIREIYAADYGKTRIEDRQHLASKLMEQAKSSQDDHAAEYVLYREAMEIATEAGDINIALAALAEMTARFRIGADDTGLDAILRLTPNRLQPASSQAAAVVLLTLVDIASATDRYDVAVKASAVAVAHAQNAKDPLLLRRARERSEDVRALAEEFKGFVAAEEVLKTRPDDGKANGVVGRFVCFKKGDWKRGLPYLAKAIDPPAAALRAAAQHDLANPTDGPTTLAVGDAWYDLSRTMKADSLAIEARARYWYEIALPNLQGLAKMKAAKRIEGISQIKPTPAGAGTPPPIAADPRRPIPNPPNQVAIRFIEDKSMKFMAAGHQERSKNIQFPRQEGADPLGPFSGHGIYFDQHTAGRELFYEVNAPIDVRQIYSRGTAAKNMTIEVFDPKGALIKHGGPFAGLFTWDEFAVDIPPTRSFILHIHSDATNWMYIDAIELRANPQPCVNGVIAAPR